uniref:uncharacterized protein LOC120332361 isoform X1 n=1 Tax=Styela clava TaxID=7725 RepID=UPI00193A0E6A|nr:uncharacterized protein LOC120332361 isoform X1 [Styela clava]XP_039255526.1 uncharacterized protein LOC120332361 isoform X2 [Styela clava]
MNCSKNNSNSFSKSFEDVLGEKFYVDIVVTMILIYLTFCQIYVLISKRLFKLQLGKCTDLLLSSNLRSVMSFTLVFTGLVALSKMVAVFIIHRNINSPTYIADVLLSQWAFTSEYLILWLRQTMFHSEPSLRHLSSKPLHNFSRFQGFFMLFFNLFFSIVIGYYGIQNNVIRLTCLPTWITFCFLLYQIETQICTLALFIIPLFRHRKTLKKSFKGQRLQQKSINLLKRSMIITPITILSDILAFVVLSKFGLSVVYNVNVAFNLWCLLLCFDDWKDRMLPCYPHCKCCDGKHQENNLSSSNVTECKTNEEDV